MSIAARPELSLQQIVTRKPTAGQQLHAAHCQSVKGQPSAGDYVCMHHRYSRSCLEDWWRGQGQSRDCITARSAATNNTSFISENRVACLPAAKRLGCVRPRTEALRSWEALQALPAAQRPAPNVFFAEPFDFAYQVTRRCSSVQHSCSTVSAFQIPERQSWCRAARVQSKGWRLTVQVLRQNMSPLAVMLPLTGL